MSWVVPPLHVLLSFPPPNYINPPTQNALLLSVEITSFAITSLVILLRFIVRRFLNRNRRIEADDYLILTATAFAFAMTLENCGAVRYGWCKHIWDVRREDWETLLKLTTCTEVIFGLAIGFTKFSILAFYQRVFSFEATSKTFRRCLWTLYGLETCWVIINVSVSIFQCVPVRAIWDVTVTDARCNNLFAMVASMAALNSLTDVAIFALPIPWVWRLCLPKQQKLAVIGAFGLGFIVIVAGFVRIYYLRRMLYGNWDLTWYGASVYATTAIEVDLGIICASVPSLKALFYRLPSPSSPSSFPTTSSTNPSSYKPPHIPPQNDAISNPWYYHSSKVDEVMGVTRGGEGAAEQATVPEWVTNDVELGDIKRLGNGDGSSMSVGVGGRKGSEVSVPPVSVSVSAARAGRYGSL